MSELLEKELLEFTVLSIQVNRRKTALQNLHYLLQLRGIAGRENVLTEPCRRNRANGHSFHLAREVAHSRLSTLSAILQNSRTCWSRSHTDSNAAKQEIPWYMSEWCFFLAYLANLIKANAIPTDLPANLQK